MWAHVTVAAQVRGADHALLAVRAKLALRLAAARHDEAHGEARERLLPLAELARLEAVLVGLGRPRTARAGERRLGRRLGFLREPKRPQARLDCAGGHTRSIPALLFLLDANAGL